MAAWRFARGWSERELEEQLSIARTSRRNFTDPVENLSVRTGWREYYSEAVVARERPGPPEKEGPFSRGRQALSQYAFSDPRIVIAHFDPTDPLLGRYMLLEARAFRVLHYLGGVVVGDVRSEATEDRTVFGFRYDTLEGHIERGAEWFLLTKDYESGEIRFRIQAAWQPGQFPNWWSRLGFRLVGKYYQRRWHRHAHGAMMRMMSDEGMPRKGPARERLRHSGPEVVFKRLEAHNV